MITLLDPTFIRDTCDYSFGDNSGIGAVPDGYMKPANIDNAEFIKKYREILASGRKAMVVFIDGIRLYKRKNVKYTALEQANPDIREIKDRKVQELFKYNDLLELCAILADMNFVIFSAFEDTPIDEEIFDKIPPNVLAIYASNAIVNGGKVIPFPYGLQRKLNEKDNRLEIIQSMLDDKSLPTNLLYVNHSLYKGVNERNDINAMFSNKGFAKVDTDRLPYKLYYERIKASKFVLCPSGNAIGCECHRDWEALYMKRVPVVLRSPYLEKMFDKFPVLFVNDWSEVTEELLIKNNFLYDRAQKMDMSELDLKEILDKIYKKHNIGIAQKEVIVKKKDGGIYLNFEINILDTEFPFLPMPLNKMFFLNRPTRLGRFADLLPKRENFIFDSESTAEQYLTTTLIPILCPHEDVSFTIRKIYKKN